MVLNEANAVRSNANCSNARKHTLHVVPSPVRGRVLHQNVIIREGRGPKGPGARSPRAFLSVTRKPSMKGGVRKLSCAASARSTTPWTFQPGKRPSAWLAPTSAGSAGSHGSIGWDCWCRRWWGSSALWSRGERSR